MFHFQNVSSSPKPHDNSSRAITDSPEHCGGHTRSRSWVHRRQRHGTSYLASGLLSYSCNLSLLPIFRRCASWQVEGDWFPDGSFKHHFRVCRCLPSCPAGLSDSGLRAVCDVRTHTPFNKVVGTSLWQETTDGSQFQVIMNALLVIIFGLLGAFIWRGQARTLFLSSGALLAVLGILRIVHLPIPFGYKTSTVLVCVFSLAAAGVVDMVCQRLITRWKS